MPTPTAPIAVLRRTGSTPAADSPGLSRRPRPDVVTGQRLGTQQIPAVFADPRPALDPEALTPSEGLLQRSDPQVRHHDGSPGGRGPANRTLVRRIQIGDLHPNYQPFHEEPWIRELLRLVTGWEDEGKEDPLEYAYRAQKAKTIVNGALYEKIDDIYESKDRAAALKTICEGIKARLDKALPFDPITALHDVLFPGGFFMKGKLIKHQARIKLLTPPAQAAIAREVATATDFEMADFLPCFPALLNDPAECGLIFESVAAGHSFLSLSPERQTACVEAFFGTGGQLIQSLGVLRKTRPALALLIGPAIFSAAEGASDASPTVVASSFGSKAMKAILDPVYLALKKDHAMHLADPILQLFADFLVRSRIDEDGMAKLSNTLTSVLSQRTIPTRADLLQILIELLRPDPGSDEIVEGLGKLGASPEIEFVESKAAAYLKPICLALISLSPGWSRDSKFTSFIEDKKLKASRSDQQVTLSTLLEVRACSLEPKQKQIVVMRLFQTIVPIDTFSDKIQVFGSVATCIKLKRLDVLVSKNDYRDLGALLSSELHTVVGLEKEELTNENLERLAAQLRNVNDLVTYAATLNKLENAGQRDRALAGLRSFVLSIIKDRYQQLRYGLGEPADAEKWKHLQTVLGIDSEALREWMKGSESEQSPQEFFSYNGKRFIVMDTDAPATMLMIGSDFQTCQSINKDPSLSKCLLSYMIDGKNRAIVVKLDDRRVPEKDRRPVARALFKALFNPTTNTAVLFIEKIYCTLEIDAEVARKAILHMAQLRASAISRHIKLDLAAESTVGANLGEPYPQRIHSLGGPAPFDYNDVQVAAGGPDFVIEEGFARLVTAYPKS